MLPGNASKASTSIRAFFAFLESALLSKQKKGSPQGGYMYKLFAWSHCNLFLHVYKIGIPGRDCEKQVKQRQE